jgi:hypothetical protein
MVTPGEFVAIVAIVIGSVIGFAGIWYIRDIHHQSTIRSSGLDLTLANRQIWRWSIFLLIFSNVSYLLLADNPLADTAKNLFMTALLGYLWTAALDDSFTLLAERLTELRILRHLINLD